MAVRFIVGRAGTGKTQHCVDAIAMQLRDAPLGPPLLWIVPEQGTFNAERLLITHPEIRGSFRARVTSFRRLTLQVAEELGLSAAEELDDLARIVLLGDLVQRQRSELELFGPVADRPGFIQRLDAMLRELQQAAHTGDTLRKLAGQQASADASSSSNPPTSAAGQTVLTRKLRDLARLLDAWDQTLIERSLESDRLMTQVAARLGESELLSGARIWVDAFSAFSVVEMQLLAALAQRAAGLEITLLADPFTTAMRDPDSPLEDQALFYRTQRVYHRLMREFQRSAVRVEPNRVLGRQHRLQSPALELIERQLFEPSAGAAQIPAEDPPGVAGVALWECANPHVEVHAAAQEIKRLVASGMRYRQIGLIIPALETYVDPVRRIFAQHHIPHFIDQRRSIAHYPLVELLRTAVALAQHRCASDDLILFLKTGLAGIADGEAHQLENYLLAHGIRRHDLHAPFVFLAPNQDEDDTAQPPTDAQRAHLAAVNATRERLAKRLGPWLELCGQEGPWPGDVLARRLYELLFNLEVPRQIEAMIEEARQSANQEMLLIHQQAWRQTVTLFETLERVLHQRPTSLDDFARILTAALESLTLGIIPPTVDQVLVSSVTRSRHPELAVVLILGAVESRFPLVRPEDPLLNDQQRAVFNALVEQEEASPFALTTVSEKRRRGPSRRNGAGPIGPGSAQDLLEAQFFDYVAFTRASRRLIVSYPLADEKGKAVARSAHIGRLRGLFPDLQPRIIDGEVLHDLTNLATLDDALVATLKWARRKMSIERQSGDLPPHAADAALPGLYDWLVRHDQPEIQTLVAEVWPALAPHPAPMLSTDLAAALHRGGQQLRMSVSQLEKFAACPLQYFFHYTLGLVERPVMQLDVLNLGTLYHRILEKVYTRIIRHDLPWPQCAAEDLRQILEQEVDAAAVELHKELADAAPQYAKVRQRAKIILGLVLESQRRAACQGDVRPVATELSFGFSPDAASAGVPPLEVKTPQGRLVRLSGKIDRLDLAQDSPAAVVIDYKSSSEKTLELYRLYHGLQLQLASYLLVVQERAGDIAQRLHRPAIQPVAAFFVPMGRSRRQVADLRQLIDPASDAFFQQHLPRGLINAAAFEHLDRTMDGVQVSQSDWYKCARKRIKKSSKDDSPPPLGELAKRNNDAVEPEDFALILAFTRRRIATLVDDLAGGRIAPRPCKDSKQASCDQCEFACTCPFDRVHGLFRDIAKMDRDDTLAAMREEVAHGG